MKMVMQCFNLFGWLARAAFATAMLLCLAAQAGEQCAPADAGGVQRCKAGLAQAQIQQIQRTQEKSQWCWAASIAMIFAHHGVNISQEQVVRRRFPDLADRGVTGAEISGMLSHSWVDAGGHSYFPGSSVADADARRFGVSQATLVLELGEERPMIFGAEGHVMVLVQVDYERSGVDGGLRITGATVIDPAPGKGLRKLLRQEMRPNYVAAVQVAPQPQLAAVSGPSAH
jgi:hypothetical protein